jgi:hypothetical protein
MSSTALTILKAACLVSFGLGLVSVAAAHPATDGPWLLFFSLLDWPPLAQSHDFSREARVLNAVLGGVLAGWSVMMFWLAAGPVARGDQGARAAFLASVTLWFVLDSFGSLVAGWPGNVVSNFLLFLLFAAPLHALRNKRAA